MLVALSKNTANQWEIMCDDHKTYDEKRHRVNTILSALEEKLSLLQTTSSSDIDEKIKKLQSIVTERDEAIGWITDYLSCGESLLSDTATVGREYVRIEMTKIQERQVIPHSPLCSCT
jgi:hypothetical protein